MKKICLIFGGKSSEHEVSLRSASAILGGIDTSKYEVLLLGITKDGKWYLWEQYILSDIRQPESANPWA